MFCKRMHLNLVVCEMDILRAFAISRFRNVRAYHCWFVFVCVCECASVALRFIFAAQPVSAYANAAGKSTCIHSHTYTHAKRRESRQQTINKLWHFSVVSFPFGLPIWEYTISISIETYTYREHLGHKVLETHNQLQKQTICITTRKLIYRIFILTCRRNLSFCL